MAKMHLFIGDITSVSDLTDTFKWLDSFNFEDNHWRCYMVIDGEEYFFRTEDEFKIYLVHVLRLLWEEKKFTKRSIEIAYARPGKPNGTIDLTKEIEFIRLFKSVINSIIMIPHSLSGAFSFDLNILFFSLQILIFKEILESLFEYEALADGDYMKTLESIWGQEVYGSDVKMAVRLFEGRWSIDTLNYQAPQHKLSLRKQLKGETQ